MPSFTEIGNMALSHLGQGELVGQIENETSPAAKVLRTFQSAARDATLRDFDWGFASRIISLPLVMERPNSEWGYSYRQPAQCLFIRRILSGVRNETLATLVPFRTLSDDSGILIVTDKANAELEYTHLVNNASLYPPDFILALSFRWAAYIAPRLTAGDKAQLGVRAMQFYNVEIGRARANTKNESVPDYPPDSEFITARS